MADAVMDKGEGKRLVMGVDFGTASVRAIVADASDGTEVGHGSYCYRGGRDGCVETPGEEQAVRHEPGEYLLGLEACVLASLSQARENGFSPSRVEGIGIDCTGSTIFPVLRDGTPLAFLPAFRDNYNAKVWLWKDHSAIAEAEEITSLAKKEHPEFLSPIGGRHSAEMYWAKVLHCLRVDRSVALSAASWVEMLDWIPFVLTGGSDVLSMKRSACGAGAKALFDRDWGGYPPPSFLASLDPDLPGMLSCMKRENVRNSALPAGRLCLKWAKRLGLREGIVVTMGSFDAHYGGIGAGIRDGTLVETIGTSACLLSLVPKERGKLLIPGMFDVVRDSIIPLRYGIEAGQSSVGDIFNWYVNTISPGGMSFRELGEKASSLSPGKSGLLALDWLNGNRSLFLDQRLSGLIVGLTLKSRPEEIYRALLESTGFGSRIIVERIREYGVPVEKLVVCGGIPHKDPFMMQLYADILGMTVHVAKSRETCALGGAIVASVNAGLWGSFEEAEDHMCHIDERSFSPRGENKAVYDRLFALYGKLSYAFATGRGGQSMDLVMKELLEMRKEQ